MFSGIGTACDKNSIHCCLQSEVCPCLSEEQPAYCELEVYMIHTKVKFHMQEQLVVSQSTCLPDLAKGHGLRERTACIILCKENL